MTLPRTRRPQAVPLWQGASWQITRADVWIGLALLAMLVFAFWLYRSLYPWL